MLYAVKMGALGYAVLQSLPRGVQEGHELCNYIYSEMFGTDVLDPELPGGYLKIGTIDELTRRTGLTANDFSNVITGEYVEFPELK